MVAKGLFHFLLFSQALAGGYDWLLTREQWQKRQAGGAIHQQAKAPQAEQPWPRAPRGRYQQPRDGPLGERQVVTQIGDGQACPS